MIEFEIRYRIVPKPEFKEQLEHRYRSVDFGSFSGKCSDREIIHLMDMCRIWPDENEEKELISGLPYQLHWEAFLKEIRNDYANYSDPIYIVPAGAKLIL